LSREDERSLLIAATAIADTVKEGCYLGGDDSGGGGSGGIRTGLKSRRYLLLVAVTSFNSYQFYGHTSLPGRYNGDFGGLGPRPQPHPTRTINILLCARKKYAGHRGSHESR